MFCANCGSELEKGARFCPECGAPVEPVQPEKTVQNPGNTQASGQIPPAGGRTTSGQTPASPKKNQTVIIAAIIAAVVLIIGGGLLYGTVGLAWQKNSAVSKIEKAGLKDYQSEEARLAAEWENLGVLDFGGKRAVVKELKELKKGVDVFQDCASELSEMEKEKKQYDLDSGSYSAYESALKECRSAIKKKEGKKTQTTYKNAVKALEALKSADDQYISDQVSMYENVDLSEASSKEVSSYKTILKEIQSLTKEKTRNYKSIQKTFAKMDQAIYLYIDPKNPLDVTVQQVDASAFPKIRLYLSVKDGNTREVPKKLSNSLFYIKKKDANAKYVKQIITSAGQLNEKEALKVDMVADVSGSMDGGSLDEAKQIMSDFVNSVQFDAGDKVELTSFSTGVRLERKFTDDASDLVNCINQLQTEEETSLYDALYTSVERVAAQNGARCVIAFTDGQDNHSNCSPDTVIRTANRYHVPIFIIGIGGYDYNDARYIAEQTGGAYYSVTDVNGMKSIYDQVYEMEKQLYMVEFEDKSDMKLESKADIEAGYKSVEYGGSCKYSYTPNVLLSAKSADIYKDGPEAVVEGYLKNFAEAMNTNDFSEISGYLKNGSPIYKEQEKYVQRKISEQLDSYELTDVKYSGKNKCKISTRETYYVQVAGKPLQLMTQECTYVLEKNGNDWEMTSFADIKVTDRINQ